MTRHFKVVTFRFVEKSGRARFTAQVWDGSPAWEGSVILDIAAPNERQARVRALELLEHVEAAGEVSR